MKCYYKTEIKDKIIRQVRDFIIILPKLILFVSWNFDVIHIYLKSKTQAKSVHLTINVIQPKSSREKGFEVKLFCGSVSLCFVVEMEGGGIEKLS